MTIGEKDKKIKTKKMIETVICECVIDTFMIFIVFLYASGKPLLQCLLQSLLFQMIFAIPLYTLVSISLVFIILIGAVFHSVNEKRQLLVDISSFVFGIFILYVMYINNIFGVTITNLGLALVFASALRLSLIKVADIVVIRFN